MYSHTKAKILIVLLIAIAGNVHAAPVDQTVVNSADWGDVYSTLLYSSIGDKPSKFLLRAGDADVLPTLLDKSLKNVFLVESEKVPYILGYKDTLEREGYAVQEMLSQNGKATNLEIAKMADTKKFIVVDDSYGYNAISVAPYAVISKSYVLFADDENIEDVHSFLKDRGVEKLIIYGYVDREVRARLGEFNPEIIDTGSRFDDNIEIVERYRELNPRTQVTLSNGEFIEGAMFLGEEPILFIGMNDVPEQVISYAKDSGIKIGVLIGTDLVRPAQKLKRAANMSIFVKFGQGRTPAGEFGEVTGLDILYLPKYELNLSVVSIKYNSATKQLEVLYRNDAKIIAYFKSSITIFADGERTATVGDRAPVFIDAGDSLAVAYDVDLIEHMTKNLTAGMFAQYGEAPKSLDRALEKEFGIETIRVKDDSAIEVTKVEYSKNENKLKVMVKNTGSVSTYFKTQVTLIFYGEEKILSSDEPLLLGIGETKEAAFAVALTDANLEENEEVFVRINYGERQTVLIKALEGRYPLEVAKSEFNPLYLVGLIGILLAAILSLLLRKRANKE